MLKEKIKHHTRGWQVVVSIFFMLAFAPLWFEHLHQYTAPTSDYYLYDEDDPVKVVWGNTAGGQLTLKSNACFFGKGIEMVWFDSLYCDGIKIDTQKWEDYVLPWCSTDKEDTWTIRNYTFTGEEENCRLEGAMYGITSRGYKKRFNYSVDFTLVK